MSKNIKWDNYLQEIISLNKDGLSSSQIAEILAIKHGNQFKGQDRSVRRVLKENGLGNGVDPKKEAKVLIYDTETSHIIARVWGLWKQNIQPSEIIKDWFVLCWSAKWLWDDEVISMGCTPEEIESGDDKRIMQGMWNLINEADVCIYHNGIKFDRKVVQTRFLKHKLYLPNPYQEIDTLLHARKKFKVSSNRLDYLGEFLSVGRKIETEKGLWNKVEEGDKEAMDRMMKYCDQDVHLLEDVYLEMRPYIQPHPNIGLMTEDVGEPKCPTCGSTNLSESGEYMTTVNVYQNYVCNDCHSHSRSRKGNMSIKHRENILSSNPK